jgi:phosphatidylinositol alpha-1,6-mannosyltransferase
MKTLLVTLEFPPQIGGIASYTYNLASHWPEDSELIILAPKMKGDIEFDSQNKWKVYRRAPLFRFFWPRWIKLLWQVWQISKKEKIGMIFVNHALPAGYVGLIIKKILKIPFVVFFHGTDLEKGTKNRWKKKMLEIVCRNADKIIINSVFLKSKFETKFEKIKKDIEIVYPCPGDHFFKEVPTEEIDQLKSKLAIEGKKVILTVARISEGKGYPHLMRLLPKILQKIPNVVWLIVGDGPKKEALLKMAQKDYLQNIVRFVGKIPYQDLPKYYQVADLFVLLTHVDEDNEEGWGTVFLEASSSGLPIVAGQVGGVEESVENLVSGLIVDVYYDNAVVSAIVDLLNKSGYAKQMGEAGKERVAKEFIWGKQIEKIFDNQQIKK